ncbi:putative HTH-type transcriptional regulator [Streptomyces sp. RB5]|uniref:Putative HTH-type transcriptional regulator n=1 Tax=Streptomyces smaragdinus TaxID=2585196 RepID=A0A7K0CUH5_9ACTN|nr:regulator [Streptomyces smaragdinus]MQY16632.1 putative HTH-type transcriptional regulator [Streptomyces smaragdinus]
MHTTPAPCPGNLPAELTRFIGRDADLDRLAGALAGARLVTVTGVGGVGKSRLALRAATQLKERFPDGVWLVDATAGGTVAHTALQALAPPDPGGLRPPDLLVRRLAGRRALLVLDGCERAGAECAELTATLLRGAPELRVLATGRRPLTVDGERMFPLAPLPEGDAVRLFTDRARTLVPGFALEGEQARTVAGLCRRLDGIPLALELAAGRLRGLTPEQLVRRLDDRFRLLVSSGRGRPARHRTLRTTIGWSHELCAPPERLLWARLSVFAGDFDLDAAEFVCGGEGLDSRDVAEVLGELVAQSVVVREEWRGQVRFRLLDTVREYGARWLPSAAEEERLRGRHRDWYLGTAVWAELDWFSPAQSEVPGRVERELPNLRSALEHCLCRPGEGHLGQQLTSSLWFYWLACGRLTEGRVWLNRALAAGSDDSAARSRALWVSGWLYLLAGEPATGRAELLESARLADLADDAASGAHTRQGLGVLHAVTGDVQQAVETLRDVLHRLRELGRLDSLALLAQSQLGLCLAFAGDTDEALGLLAEAYDLAVEHGELWARSCTLYAWGYTLWRRGVTVRALELSLECLAIKRTFRDVVGMTMTLEHIAPLVASRDPALAARLHGGAADGWQTVGPERFHSAHFDLPHSEAERLARAALGDEGYRDAVAEGRRLGLAEAVEELLASPTAAR